MSDKESLTRQVAALCAAYEFESIPADVIAFAEIALMDCLGCMYRGAQEPLTEILGEEFTAEAWQPERLLRGEVSGLLPSNLAMLIGSAAHAIDYDDTHPMVGHVGAPVIGAVLALARTESFSNKQVLTAIVAGYECAARVSSLISGDHYEKGFHTTSTLSIFGAAAACSNLLGLNVDQTCQVIGLTTTQVSGVKSTFGTMAKPFNAGQAAASGLLAARLVAKGFTAPPNAIECPMGLMALYDGVAESEIDIAPADEYLIKQNLFKVFASCHFTHPCIEGLEMFLAENAFASEDIASVGVKVAPLAIKTAAIVEPKSGLECKFSFPQIVAMVLCGKDPSEEALFSDEVLEDAAINQLREKVTVTGDGEPDPGRIAYEITLKNGESFSWLYDYNENQPSDELVAERVEKKFLSNVKKSYGESVANTMLASFGDIKNINQTFSL